MILWANRLTPLGFCILSRHLYRQMTEPTFRAGAMPMLDPGGNIHAISRLQFSHGVPPFLIVALACYA